MFSLWSFLNSAFELLLRVSATSRDLKIRISTVEALGQMVGNSDAIEVGFTETCAHYFGIESCIRKIKCCLCGCMYSSQSLECFLTFRK
ncbi:hypothetical protein Pfo_022416 [Paulownia fortunei]|nr:hypothetical protein Pfo_022416 [Paulownia fortunei]